ncbi:NYN domain-containing protein [Fictibacillus gelatini]|uniref:NYN domain-containing protein n=1 Tax=Fictibacillus gelatini TaxID=225985 RepID=UPI0004109416|nr:NYN domain-containing protein [Fictibacillus gelatini]
MISARTALFIDGGYLDNILRAFGKAKIDYEKLAMCMSEDRQLLRAYYYHCLPYQTSHPTEEESKQFSNAQKFFRKLNRLNSFTVREGKLAFRGIDDEGRTIFEQKRVDVSLATDIVLHSTKRLITHASLLTGDSDFLPALEIAKSEGVHLTLFYSDKEDTLPHDELLDIVDERKVIDYNFIDSLRR